MVFQSENSFDSMSEKKIIDGERFWNPKEGLEAGVHVIQLMRRYIADGVITPVPLTKADVVKALQRLEVDVTAAVPAARIALQDWIFARTGRVAPPRPLRLTKREIQSLKELQGQIPHVLISIEQSKGGFRLGDLAIEYPKAEIRFYSHKSYFDFIMRSIDEVIAAACGDGMLLGPQGDQLY